MIPHSTVTSSPNQKNGALGRTQMTIYIPSPLLLVATKFYNLPRQESILTSPSLINRVHIIESLSQIIINHRGCDLRALLYITNHLPFKHALKITIIIYWYIPYLLNNEKIEVFLSAGKRMLIVK